MNAEAQLRQLPRALQPIALSLAESVRNEDGDSFVSGIEQVPREVYCELIDTARALTDLSPSALQRLKDRPITPPPPVMSDIVVENSLPHDMSVSDSRLSHISSKSPKPTVLFSTQKDQKPSSVLFGDSPLVPSSDQKFVFSSIPFLIQSLDSQRALTRNASQGKQH
jgi:hypothetical protein